MATSIFGLLLSNADVASFRAWGAALSAQIGSVLTRVTQSNDINWSTVSLPAGSSFASGSEVYRFNDSLQATAPIFLRLEYGSNTASNTSAVRVTVGKSVDGAGNLGGILLPATVAFGASLAAAAFENCYISGGSSWFAMSLAPIATSRGGFFAIERSIESGGTSSANAVLVSFQVLCSQTQQHRFIDYANSTAESVAGGIVAIPLSLASDRSIANGTTAPIFPAACISPSGVFWRPRVILGTARQNAGLGEVITGLIDGNSYLSLGAGSQRVDQRGTEFSATLIRWD